MGLVPGHSAPAFNPERKTTLDQSSQLSISAGSTGFRRTLVRGKALQILTFILITNEKNLHNVVKARGWYVLGVDCRKSSSSSAHGDACIGYALDRVRLAF